MQEKYVIEDGIPLNAKRGGGGPIRQALMSMQIGQSFVAPMKKRHSAITIARILKIKVATRTIDADTIRIHRIA